MSNIPHARTLLESILADYTLPRGARAGIVDALSLMKRERQVRRARNTSKPISAATVARIRREARRDPDASFQVIGNRAGVNPGRVSETLNGRR